MSKLPHITIITAVYNGGAYLEDTIHSIIAQPYSSLTYIIIDGGSTDNTLEIIRQYPSHISHWQSEPDRGVYDAMNKGWAMIDDDSFILFLGAGDKLVSLPNNMSAYQPTDVIYGQVLEGQRIFQPKVDFRLKMTNTLHHQALLVPKRLHPAPPFNLNYKIFADMDFNQRLLKQGATFVFDDTFKAEAPPGGLSDNVSTFFYFKECLTIVNKNFGLGWTLLALPYYTYQRSGMRRAWDKLFK